MKESYSARDWDSEENREIQKQIRDRANYSLAVLGAVAYHRTGEFLNIRPVRR